eukprot:m.261205 g.261205  ORF g.261205 m.261205 type:complete len:109 (-) comp11045_c0_seq15:241-567(-)
MCCSDSCAISWRFLSSSACPLRYGEIPAHRVLSSLCQPAARPLCLLAPRSQVVPRARQLLPDNGASLQQLLQQQQMRCQQSRGLRIRQQQLSVLVQMRQGCCVLPAAM